MEEANIKIFPSVLESKHVELGQSAIVVNVRNVPSIEHVTRKDPLNPFDPMLVCGLIRGPSLRLRFEDRTDQGVIESHQTSMVSEVLGNPENEAQHFVGLAGYLVNMIGEFQLCVE